MVVLGASALVAAGRGLHDAGLDNTAKQSRPQGHYPSEPAWWYKRMQIVYTVPQDDSLWPTSEPLLVSPLTVLDSGAVWEPSRALVPGWLSHVGRPHTLAPVAGTAAAVVGVVGVMSVEVVAVGGTLLPGLLVDTWVLMPAVSGALGALLPQLRVGVLDGRLEGPWLGSVPVSLTRLARPTRGSLLSVLSGAAAGAEREAAGPGPREFAPLLV